jgi:hypothetical protein
LGKKTYFTSFISFSARRLGFPEKFPVPLKLAFYGYSPAGLL